MRVVGGGEIFFFRIPLYSSLVVNNLSNSQKKNRMVFDIFKSGCSEKSSVLDSVFANCSMFGSTKTDLSEWSAPRPGH